MRPFEGIRVLDLTHVLAGPFSTYQLACLGADVIKIESPSNPDMTRIEGVDAEQCAQQYGSYFQSQNAGKRAMTLNLKTEAGREVLWRLIGKADVLVQNFAGESLEQLGFGYEAVAERNPLLIYCSITGYGATGPKASHPAYDVVIQAYSGLMSANGEADSPPVRVGPPMVDYGTGAQAAFAISAALFQREKTGKGQYIDVAMMDAALMLMSAFVVDTTLTGQAPVAHGNNHPSYAGYATYDTADGQIMLGAWSNRQLQALLEVVGETELASDVAASSRQAIGQFHQVHSAVIQTHMRKKSANEWERLLNDAHVPASRIRSLDETLTEAQTASRQVLQSPSGETRAGCPQQFAVTAFSYAHGSPSIDRPPPWLGEHTRDILHEAGYTDRDIDMLLSQKAV